MSIKKHVALALKLESAFQTERKKYKQVGKIQSCHKIKQKNKFNRG